MFVAESSPVLPNKHIRSAFVALWAAQSICAHEFESPYECGGYGCGSDFVQISQGKDTDSGEGISWGSFGW